MSFSSNDPVGHEKGPDSPEVHDISVATDRALGRLFSYLETRVGMRNVLVVLTAVYASALDILAVSIYVAGLLSMLVLSATYNLWPVSRTKWVLRRLDHSAIYMLIAATYTPFILERRTALSRSRC